MEPLHNTPETIPDAAAVRRRRDEIDRLGDTIAELAARIQAATYELLVLIREFDEGGGWTNGFRSCAHWLNWRTGLDLGAAREKVRVARTLAELPLLSGAMRRYQVVVHVDEDVLEHDVGAGQSVLEDGAYVSGETSRRVACDAARVVMRHGRDGRVLDVGRKTRTVPAAIRRALAARDRRCRFPGCNARHCDAHHVRHWAAGGATRLDNMVLLCRRHHRAVHEEGFNVTLCEDGAACFFWPDGRPLPAAPPAPRWTGPPLGPTLARLDTAGITIGARTATPHWYGEPLDVGWAIDVLWRPRSTDPPCGDISAGTPVAGASREHLSVENEPPVR